MRFLLLLPWCFLLSLATPPPVCNWKMPTTVPECTQTIDWKWRSDKQATATCFEYFPTTFVEGKMGTDDSKIECTVSRQFSCDYLISAQMKEALPIFDKCYTFQHENEVTMEEYTNPTKRLNYCQDGGGIPVFLTMTQAKHIAMAAHRKDIFKIWVNVNKEGRTIEKSGTFNKDDLLYKEQWKVNNDYYWKGDTLVKIDKDDKNATDGKPKMDFLNDDKTTDPNEKNIIEYLFFRTRTDHVHNMLQGSFERATKMTKATIVCEYPAKIVPDQKKYCGKMKELTINAIYDDSRGRRRCVYTSLTTYSLDGTKEAMRDFPGCREKPSTDLIAGIDDGTAIKQIYDKLTSTGTYRMSAIKVNPKGEDVCYGDCPVLDHCDTKTRNEVQYRQPFAIFNHFQKQSFTREMTASWAAGYPKDECTDFPSPAMDSKTLAISKTQIIDVPVPVRFPAICSIELDGCSSRTAAGKPICGLDEVCTNVEEWKTKTQQFAECECVRYHECNSNGVFSKWKGSAGMCGVIHRFDGKDLTDANYWKEIPIGEKYDFHVHLGESWANHIDRAVVRKGCTMTIWSHPVSHTSNLKLLKLITYGEYVVPLYDAGTLNGWGFYLSASLIDCWCPPNY